MLTNNVLGQGEIGKVQIKRVLAIAAIIVAAAGSSAAQAATVTIDVPSAAAVDTTTTHYSCGKMQVTVDYINAGPVSLAVLHLPNDLVVAANVISASGARYAGAQYIWWTSGSGVTLADLMHGGEDAPIQCTERP